MTWEKIIKRNCGCGKDVCETYGEVVKAPPLTPEDEKEIQDMMRFRNMSREDAERSVRRKSDKLGHRKPATGRFIKSEKTNEEVEKEIVAMFMKEGGALGMKNLKGITSRKQLTKVLADMKRKKLIYVHKHGDLIMRD